MGSDVVVARVDPRLVARVVRRTPLEWASPAAPEDDRPPFVRAASAVVFIGGELVVAQDDASFLAVGRPGEKLRAIALPRGAGGRRRFEERLGNKRDKLDLEAGVAIDGRVYFFGSGSLPVREHVVVFDPRASAAPVRVVDASPLYAKLHAAHDFAGGELNLEGVTRVESPAPPRAAAPPADQVRFFQRGNGAAPGLMPATADVDAARLVAFLEGRAPPPELAGVRRFDLGSEDGARYGFTDATTAGDAVVFLASAERSPNAIDDGEVTGSRVGVLSPEGARLAPLLDTDGALARIKAEGIAIDPSRRDRAWIVIDADDPDRPSELCEVALDGPWSTPVESR
ncbi:MAG TPA: hypothetical protein VL400_09520 [Polyangiaceae bacterium]|nr:hypothetical protein [Polyangiaceae bacterium]